MDGLRFNGTSLNIMGKEAVYIDVIRKQQNTTAKAVGFITDSVFRELGHENPGFASSFLSNGSIFTNGTWKAGNTTFLANKNVMAVDGGFLVRLVKVKINSTRGKAIVLTLNNAVLSDSNSSSLVISDSEFLSSDISVLAQIQKGLFAFNLSRCVFQGNTKSSKSGGNILLPNEHQTVTKAEVFELGQENNGFAWSFLTNDIVFTRGTLRIFNTTFLHNKNAVLVAGGLDAQLVNVKIDYTNGNAILVDNLFTVSSTRSSSLVISDPECLNNSESVSVVVLYKGVFALNISRCIFQGKMGRFNGTSWDSSQSLVVKESSFIGSNETRDTGDAIRFQVYSDYLYRPPFIKGELTLENVTFQELHNSALYVRMQRNVKEQVLVKDCKFVNDSALIERLSEQPNVQIEFDEEDPPKCLNNDKLVWKNRSQIRVILENSVFENNVGISGALNVLNGNVSLINCTFKNNEGLTMGRHIYMKTGFGILHIVNSTFLQTRLNRFSDTKQRGIGSISGCFLFTDSIGPLTISNSSFTANFNINFHPILKAFTSSLIEIDVAFSLRCPPRRRVKLDKVQQDLTEGLDFTEGNKTCWIRLNYFKESCEECPDRFYGLQRGLVTGMNICKGTECLECPYGATCEHGNAKAKENFWGMNVSASFPKMQFFPCPLGYCGSPSDSSDYVYSACRGNRSGVLCGNCSDGYSETLYSPLCREKEKCNDHWFWLATTIYVVFLALYLVFKPAIFSELYRHSLWFKRRTKRFDVQQLRLHNDQNHDPGYLKIIFHFYQVVKLVMVNSPETTLSMVPIIPPVIAIFNFQVKTLNDRIGCPFPGLTAVTKALFQCTTFLGTLLSIGFTYVIHRAASKFRYISAPSVSLYLAVALETLLLGYERLADTSLKLMHCVPIDEEWRLFVDGNIQCWQWWQYLIIAFVLSFIIPLILVLFWGSLLLAKDRLTAEEFLLACAFPLPHLVTWTIRHLRNRDSERVVCSPSDTDEIKKVLYGPFREPSSVQHSTLYWKSVLTGRSLLLLIIHTFATDPIIRFLCLNCACVLILVHHLTMRPFREPKANVFEGLSLLSLVVICSFSLAEATYISEGIDPIEKNQNLFRVLQWIEIVLIGLLPVAACILVIFATLSQVVRLLYHCIRCLLQGIRCKCLIVQLRMPRRLLLNWDQEDAELIV